MDIATDVYIDRVDGAPCCKTTLQLFKGHREEALHQRRTSLLLFLRGNAKEKTELQSAEPEMYKYFEDVWKVQERHMSKNLPENYECASFCAGHYLRPEEHKDYVTEFRMGACTFKPPSVIIKEEFYGLIKNNKGLSDGHIQQVAKRTLLSVDELNMHVDHLRLTTQRRKEGAKKAACTKAKKKSGKCTLSHHVIHHSCTYFHKLKICLKWV